MMNGPGFSRIPARYLDPAAQEFFPSAAPPPHIYYNIIYTRPQFPPTPPFVSASAEPPPTTATFRTLLLSMVPASASESTVRRELEVFGDVRSVQMERRREGLVTVHFYDVRDAEAALMAIQKQHMQQQFRLGRHYEGLMSNVPPPLPLQTARGLISGRVVWAQFITPVTSSLPDGNNQGILVIFNLGSVISASSLKGIFQEFGAVKELKETPNRRFVEFYDVRDAARAMAAMNGKENVAMEFSRPQDLNSSSRGLAPWKGNPSGSDGSRSFSSLCISTGCDEFSANNNIIRCHKRSLKKEDDDPRFLIKEVESNCRDPRTTLMIKNIPNKYSQKLVLNMLDNHCIHCNEQMTGGDDQPLSSYDFLYLPIDFINKCNVGYGFVNMTSPEATLRLYKAFHHHYWEVFNSTKICEVTYARLQGLDALRKHFNNSKFPVDAQEYIPVVFSPPRDGRTLSDPVPIVGPSLSTFLC